MSVSPPRPPSPPLTALRAFEAAARLRSFSAAADELSVTAGAISQQIKTMEDWAGTKLFVRRAQGVVLSEAGHELAPAFTRAFDALSDAIALMRARAPTPELNIATLPSIAQLWLQPRLPALRKLLPQTSISVFALETPPDLGRGMFDCSLFFEVPNQQGITLADDLLVPVCTQELARSLKEPSDLLDHTLLIDETWSKDWPDWLSTLGISIPAGARVSRYSLYSLALADALSGQGILMGHAPLVQSALNDGRLVCPFTQTCPRSEKLTLKLSSQWAKDGIDKAILQALGS